MKIKLELDISDDVNPREVADATKRNIEDLFDTVVEVKIL